MRITGQTSFLPPYQPAERNRRETGAIKPGGPSGAKTALHPQSESDIIISALFEQRQKIIDNKKEITDAAFARGESLQSIQETLKELDKQIGEINQQIAQQRQADAEKKLEDSKPDEGQPGGGQQPADDGLADVVSLGNDLSKIQTTASIKGRLKGQARVLAQEIAMDEGRSVSGLKSDRKRSQLQELNGRISSLDRKAGKQIRELNGKVAEIRASAADTAPQPGEVSEDRARKIEAYRLVNENESPEKPELDTMV